MVIKTLLTADDLLALPDNGMRHELVRGELRTMTPAGYQHGKIAMRLGARVLHHAEAAGLGEVLGAETGFRIFSDPDTVRAPDVAFVSAERAPASEETLGFWRGVPDLVAEVVSPSDRYEEVEEKVLDWLRAGARLVWVVNPRTRTVAVHAPGADVRILGEGDTLVGGDVLPGFACRIAELFA